jgi:hypothetical protein
MNNGKYCAESCTVQCKLEAVGRNNGKVRSRIFGVKRNKIA